MIYHIIRKSDWEKALAAGAYAPPSLEQEGFIHLSRQVQVEGVLERYYSGVPDLLMLCVEEEVLGDELRYDYSPTMGEDFPHLYRALRPHEVSEVRVVR